MRKSGLFPIQTPDGVMVPDVDDDDCEVLSPESDAERIQPTDEVGWRINFRLLLVMLGLLILLPIIMAIVHKYQMSRMASAFLQRAERAEQEDELKVAAENLENYLRFEPDDVQARIRMTLHYHSLATTDRDKQQVYYLLSEALRAAPDRDDLRRRRLDLLMEGQLYRQALFDLDILIANFERAPEQAVSKEEKEARKKSSLELELLRAECYEELGEREKAIRSYRRAIVLDPQQVSSYRHLAALLARRAEDRQEAQSVLDKLVTANRDSFDVYVTRAHHQHELGNLAKAIEDARIAYQLAPQEMRVLLLVASLVSVEARAHDEVTGFDVADVRVNLERLLKELRNPHAAKNPSPDEGGSDEPTLNPEQISGVIVEALANLDVVSGQPDSAIRRLRASIAESPENARFRWTLGNILITQGRLNEARALLAEIDALEFPWPLRGFLEARLMEARGEWRAAIEQCRRLRTSNTLLKVFPGGVDLMEARCQRQLAHLELQFRAYQRAVIADPLSSEGRMGLAETLVEMGRIDQAIEVLKKLASIRGVPLKLAQLEVKKNLRVPSKQRNWDEANRLLDLATGQGEDLIEILILRAQLQLHQADSINQDEKISNARSYLATALDQERHRTSVWLALAELENYTGKPDLALKVLADAKAELGEKSELLRAELALIPKVESERSAEVRIAEVAEQLASFSETEQVDLLWAVAVAYEKIDRLDLAEEYWSRVSERQPTALPVIKHRIDLALRSRQFDRVGGPNGLLAKIQEIEGKEGIQAQLEQARFLIAQSRRKDRKQLDQARSILDRLRKRNAISEQVLITFAELEDLEGNQEDAIHYLRLAVELGTSNPLVVRGLVQRLNERGRFADATAVIEQFRANTQSELSEQFGWIAAQTMVRAGDYEQALSYATQNVPVGSTDFREYLWLAQMYLTAGKPKEAEIWFASAKEHGRKEPAFWKTWLRYLKSTGRDDQLAKELKQAKSQFSETDQPLALAQVLESVREFDQAKEYYLDALKADPDKPSLLLTVAQFYRRIGDRQTAEKLLRQVISDESAASDDQRIEARRSLAHVLVAEGGNPRFVEAQRLLDENIEQNPRGTTDQRIKAALLARRRHRRDHREAERIYRELQNRSFLHREDQLVLARLYMTLDRWSDAKLLVEDLVSKPNCAPSDLAFGIEVMINYRELETAAELLKRLSEARPHDLQTYFLRARYLIGTGKTKEGLAELDKVWQETKAGPALATKAQVATLLLGITESLDRAGRVVQAGVVAKRCQELFEESLDDHPDQLFQLVRLLRGRKKYDEAIKLLDESWTTHQPAQIVAAALPFVRKLSDSDEWLTLFRKRISEAMQDHPEDTGLVLQAANLAHLHQDYAQAIELFRKFLNKEPDSIIALNELALLLTLSGEDPEKALELINHAIDLSGPAALLLDTRAIIYLALDKPQLAADDLSQSLEDTPKPAKYYHMARARHMLGDELAAKTAFQNALKLAKGVSMSEKIHPLELKTFRELNRSLQ